MKTFNTPILFIIFNRPDTTFQVFNMIRKIKPSKLYVACDGPREKKENEKVLRSREIATNIDWPCEIRTIFSHNNLGCKKACIKAIDWFFENEERGIILEDDCLPHIDFFNFCENLLEYYSVDDRVSFITGDNFQNNKLRGDGSYYFSKYIGIWGWATWRRSWKKYDVGNMNFWPEWCNSNHFKDLLSDKVERKYWQNIFNLSYLDKIDTWCYPLLSSVWHKGGLTVTPNVNLVSNIGFGLDATHTKFEKSPNSKIATNNIGILNHPKKIERDIDADTWTFDHHCGGKNLRFPFYYIYHIKKILSFLLKKY